MVRNGSSVQSFLGNTTVLEGVERICAPYESKYTHAGLVTTPSERSRAITAIAAGLLAVLGLAAAKIVVALSTGHTNILFLVLLALVFAVVIPVVCKPSRLNARGRSYAKSTAALYEATRANAGLTRLAPSTDAGSLPLYVALAGVPVLAGTEYAPFQRAVAPPSSGSSCSSSGCGSGGDGGGGGCGGGGCGGCGGS
jgi:uncharacterized protein (TIGR04222 family)